MILEHTGNKPQEALEYCWLIATSIPPQTAHIATPGWFNRLYEITLDNKCFSFPTECDLADSHKETK